MRKIDVVMADMQFEDENGEATLVVVKAVEYENSTYSPTYLRSNLLGIVKTTEAALAVAKDALDRAVVEGVESLFEKRTGATPCT